MGDVLNHSVRPIRDGIAAREVRLSLIDSGEVAMRPAEVDGPGRDGRTASNGSTGVARGILERCHLTQHVVRVMVCERGTTTDGCGPSFTHHYAYDVLGEVTSLQYPTCNT